MYNNHSVTLKAHALSIFGLLVILKKESIYPTNLTL